MVKAWTALVVAAFGGALVVAGIIAVACQPTLNDTVSIVTTTTVLAVQAEPPEAPEGTPVAYRALVADGDGGVASAPVEWDYCNARNPLSNLDPVANACAQPSSGQFTPIGHGLSASGLIPDQACKSFGPEAPPVTDSGVDGGMGRPADPDSTGGYYQPVSVFLKNNSGPTEITIYPERMNCGFSGATAAVSTILLNQYHANVNPQVESLSLVQNEAAGSALLPDTTDKVNSVSAGQKVAFRVAWPSCPLVDKCGDGVCGANESAAMELGTDAGGPNPLCTVDCAPLPSCPSFPLANDGGTVNCIPPSYTSASGTGATCGNHCVSCPHDCESLVGGCPAGCEVPEGCPAQCQAPLGCPGAERYVNLDLATQAAVYQREGMHVAWYATAGTFDNDRTGRDGTDDTTSSDNGWTAPSATGPAHLWVVLRDDRGGVGWAGYALQVQ